MKAKAFSLLFALALAVTALAVAQTAEQSPPAATPPVGASTVTMPPASAATPAQPANVAPVASSTTAAPVVTPSRVDEVKASPTAAESAPSAHHELPRTASPLATLALLALATAGSAFALRLIRRRV